MKLHELTTAARKTRKRVGRGNGSKRGTFCGRGCNGQNSRAGNGKIRIGFEGGQTPLLRRIPKLKGFKNPNREPFLALNLQKISAKFSDGETVNLETLREKKIISKITPVKILSNGEISAKLIFENLAVSRAAKTKIEKAGGEIKNEVLPKNSTKENSKKVLTENLKSEKTSNEEKSSKKVAPKSSTEKTKTKKSFD